MSVPSAPSATVETAESNSSRRPSFSWWAESVAVAASHPSLM